MSLTDEEFREQHAPLHVPAAYNKAATIKDKIVLPWLTSVKVRLSKSSGISSNSTRVPIPSR